MSSDIDWNKLISALSGEIESKRKKATPIPEDPLMAALEKTWAADEKKREQQRAKEQREYDRRTTKLESNIIRLEQIDGELKKLDDKKDADQVKLVELFYARLLLLSDILRSGVDIPESKAATYYASMQTMNHLAAEKHLENSEASQKIAHEIESAYADYCRNQMRIHETRFKEEWQDGYVTSGKANASAEQILECGRKALEQFKKMEDSGMITVKVGSPYEVYNDGIIMDMSADGTCANIRVKAKDYHLYDILETLIRYSVTRSQMEAARQYEKDLNELDLGFRLKGVSNRVEYETANCRSGKAKSGPLSSAPPVSRRFKLPDLPDFVWLIIAGIVIVTVLILVLVLVFGAVTPK